MINKFKSTAVLTIYVFNFLLIDSALANNIKSLRKNYNNVQRTDVSIFDLQEYSNVNLQKIIISQRGVDVENLARFIEVGRVIKNIQNNISEAEINVVRNYFNIPDNVYNPYLGMSKAAALNQLQNKGVRVTPYRKGIILSVTLLVGAGATATYVTYHYYCVQNVCSDPLPVNSY